MILGPEFWVVQCSKPVCSNVGTRPVGSTYDICLVYLVDILIFSKPFEEHCEWLTTIFNSLECHSLKLKAMKCHLFQSKVTILGHVVSDRRIECDPDKTAAIAKRPRPTSVSEVRTFCGLASYYRAYVENLVSHHFRQSGMP